MIEWFQQLSPNTQTSFWVISVCAMTNVACALLGCYLVLRRMSLLGDALSHAVLPGLVLAFVFSGTLNVGAMLIGAALVGLLSTVLIETLNRHGGVNADASIGVVFTSLFALGVVLIKRYGSSVDLDADCVLGGILEMVDLNVVPIAGYEIPRAIVTIVPVLLINIVFIGVFWKELLLSSFDNGLAKSMGFRPGLMHYSLMTLVALTTVASFEQVGSILVVAMLIAPGATAHLLTDRLRNMLIIAAAIGIITAFLGHFAAGWLNTNTAGTMAVIVGLIYLAAMLLSPRYGLISAMVRNLQTSLRILREDVLAMLYRLEELAVEYRLGPGEAIQAVGGGWLGLAALRSLRYRGLLRKEADTLRLTDRGREQARTLVRGHRLWEVYLVEQLGLPLDHVHEPAERMEHYIDDTLREHLAAELAEKATDPHGREIPE